MVLPWKIYFRPVLTTLIFIGIHFFEQDMNLQSLVEPAALRSRRRVASMNALKWTLDPGPPRFSASIQGTA
jgi:hypothetical protein